MKNKRSENQMHMITRICQNTKMRKYRVIEDKGQFYCAANDDKSGEKFRKGDFTIQISTKAFKI